MQVLGLEMCFQIFGQRSGYQISGFRVQAQKFAEFFIVRQQLIRVFLCQPIRDLTVEFKVVFQIISGAVFKAVFKAVFRRRFFFRQLLFTY